jgi:GNAT superfamily N-acetyltransferase
MGLIPIPDGEVGAVVTYLEMTKRPLPRPMPPSSLRLKRWNHVDPGRYRLLFERVGSRWLWYSRLAMGDAQLADAIGEVHVVVDRRDVEVGMIEFNFATPAECLIAFLGLVPELAGKGHGSWLFGQTLSLAWRKGIERVRVNTCTLDHPAALPAYLKAGFTPYRRAFENFPDPRVLGLLPSDTAPQIPVIRQ